MKQITVVGAGTMGHGIAQVAALGGFDTCLTDSNPKALESASDKISQNMDGGVKRGKLSATEVTDAMARLTTESSLEAATDSADMVIEAIVEDLSAKGELFARLNTMTPEHVIFATNTSSLSVTRIAQMSRRPTNVIGMHFFNPVHIMRLIEIVQPPHVDPTIVERVRDVAIAMKKDPIIVKDSPGFASSRLGVVLGLEAMRMVEQGVASAEDIDKALELGYGHPMGPLRVSDLVGLDVRLAIADYLHSELRDPHYAPPNILRSKVSNGDLGKKSGKGFYTWPTNKPS